MNFESFNGGPEFSFDDHVAKPFKVERPDFEEFQTH